MSSWPYDLIELTAWALQHEDLRHRALYCRNASALPSTPGIAWALENVAVLAIYEAALRFGYQHGATIGYEHPYPSSSGKNPQRADLAFKDAGKGKNWGYVEVKYYGQTGKSAIAADVAKLMAISNRVQRWMLVYRVRSEVGKNRPLASLLQQHAWIEAMSREFPTVTAYGQAGICDIWLGRI